VLSAFLSASLLSQTLPVPQVPAPPEAGAQASATPVQHKLFEIPLLDCSGLPCVDLATGSGKTLRLLIDTAEANSYLDIKVAQSLGLELQPLKGSDGNVINEVQQTIVPGAHFGDLPMGDFPFMVLDTTPQPDKPGERTERLPGDGVLTYNAFKNRLIQIDYANHMVRISEPQDDAQPCPHNCSRLVIKHFGSFGPVTLTADGFTLNGQPIDAQIDTLFTGTMLVYPGSVEKLGLKKESKSKHKEFFPFTQGGLKLARAEGATESFHDMQLVQNGPLYFGTTDDHLPSASFDAAVGSGLLSHAVVTFDFKGMQMWMEATSAQTPTPAAPPQPAPPE